MELLLALEAVVLVVIVVLVLSLKTLKFTPKPQKTQPARPQHTHPASPLLMAERPQIPTGRMRVATITPVFNEEEMLPQFFRHYRDQVDTMFILDNESTDRTASIVKATPNAILLRFSSGNTLNDRIQHEAIMRQKLACRGHFDYVILPDADEFVLAKSGRTIREELKVLPKDEVHGAHGYWMAQQLKEPRYRPEEPLLAQRKWGVEDFENGCKPYIIRPESSLQLCYGRHKLSTPYNKPELSDPRMARFLMLHYIAIDEEMYVRRRLHGRILRISDENRANGRGSHYFSGDEQAVRDDYNGRRHYAGLRQVLP